MPCSFTICEKDGRIYISRVSIRKIVFEMDIADSEAMEQAIAEIGQRVDQSWSDL